MNINESLLNKNECYVVGVSGGCDSMLLLDFLRKHGYHIFVAHVNYNYRYDSFVDYELVKGYCEQYHIAFFYQEFHKADYETGNFQSTARQLRYDFYKKIYKEYHCDGILLGHHKDDFIETVLMQYDKHITSHHLGIREVNIVNHMKVIRPLLNLYKADILDYCHKNNIQYHDDYTNFETDFERDKIRNLILKNMSLKEKEGIFQKAFIHNERIKKLEFKVDAYYQEYKKNGFINYSSIPKSLLNIFLYLILKDVIDSQLISYSLIQEMKNQINSDKPNIQMNLPVNYLFIKEYDNIYIHYKDIQEGYCFVIESFEYKDYGYFQLSDSGHINEGVYLDENEFPITIRTIIPGDSIQTSSGTKKISRLFINAKIPSMKRKTWPVLLNKEQKIILVPHIVKNIDYLTTKPNIFVIK